MNQVCYDVLSGTGVEGPLVRKVLRARARNYASNAESPVKNVAKRRTVAKHATHNNVAKRRHRGARRPHVFIVLCPSSSSLRPH